MAASKITIEQLGAVGQAGISRDDIVVSEIVQLTNDNDSGVRSWRWVLVDVPRGSTSVLSNPVAPAPTFTPDVEGTYIIELKVNGGSTVGETDRQIAAVRNPSITIGAETFITRYPGAEESDEANWPVDFGSGPIENTTGWWADLDLFLRMLNEIGAAVSGGDVTSVTSGDTALVTISPTTGAVVVTPTNQEIDLTEFNTFYGRNAGNVGTHSGALRNVGVGTTALRDLTDGDDNIAVGVGALLLVTTGSNNLAVGTNTGAAITTASNNTLIGGSSGTNMTSATDNLCLGMSAGIAVSTGDRNVLVGTTTAATLTTGSDNIVIGINADVPAAATSNYINIGGTIIGNTSTDRIRIAGGIGVIAGTVSLRLGATNAAFMTNVLTTTQRDALTPENGMHVYNSTDNAHQFRENGAWVGLGIGTVTSVTSGDTALLTVSPTTGAVVVTPINQEVDLTEFNTFYGKNAGNVGTHSGALRNIGIGTTALRDLTGGDDNIAIGVGALLLVTTGSNNLAIGSSAGDAITVSIDNVLIGGNTGGVITGGDGNVCVGASAGAFITTGDQNVVLGQNSGATLTTGSANILLGFAIDVPSSGVDNYINIANTIIGAQTDTRVRIGGGIGVVTGTVSLRLGATNAAFMPNVLTTAQRNALTAENGMHVYNSTDDAHQFRENGAWVGLGSPIDSFTILATAFQTTTAGWQVNIPAPAEEDPSTAGVNVCRMLTGDVESGVGYGRYVPAAATRMRFRIEGRAFTAPGSNQDAYFELHVRRLTGVTPAWTVNVAAATLAIPSANALFQEVEINDTLASFSITAGNTYQFNLARDSANVLDTLSASAIGLLAVYVEFY